MTLTKTQRRRIYDMAANDPVAKAIFASFRERERDWSYHTAERLQQFAAQHISEEDAEHLTYANVLEVIKVLDEIGLGVYKQGRKGKKTRIEWYEGVSLKEIGHAASAFNDPYVPAQAESDEPEAPEMLQHTYLLRPDLQIPVTVPQDLTPVEAHRLATFVGSLSMME